MSRLDEKQWAELQSISIDYAIMEKADNPSVMPYDSEWSTLGSWCVVAEQAQCEADDRGSAVLENAHIIDNDCSYLKSDDENVKLIGIGLRGYHCCGKR